YKPHDDRRPEPERADALYSAFFALKNLIIMLYPFVPSTMERVRQSLRLPEDVFSVDQLGTGIEPGHEVGAKQEYFPPVADGEEQALPPYFDLDVHVDLDLVLDGDLDLNLCVHR